MSVVSTDTPVRELKRAAAELDVCTSGLEKGELVANIKRARFDREGAVWLVNPEALSMDIRFHWAPLSTRERVYQLRNWSGDCDDKLSDRIVNATRAEFENSEEFAEVRLKVLKRLEDPEFADIADKLGGSIVNRVTISNVVELTHNGEISLDMDKHVLTLASGKLLGATLMHGKACTTPVTSTITMRMIVALLEEAALDYGADDEDFSVFNDKFLRVALSRSVAGVGLAADLCDELGRSSHCVSFGCFT